jgi:phage shock protein E
LTIFFRERKEGKMPNTLKKLIFTGLSAAALLLAAFIPGALAERSAGWWAHANSLAQREGYQIITTQELHDLYTEGRDFVILDNRFPYELDGGRLPDAVNLPFDLSELQDLPAEKKTQLLEALGPDKDRIVVTYCRDFR